MRTNFKAIALVFLCAAYFNDFVAQESKSKEKEKEIISKNITMRWNKSTPESEMNDDIKALKEAGVTVKYSNVKRNKNGEIIAIKVEYKADNGSSGSQEYNGSTPISDIYITKNDDKIGFVQNTLENGLAFQNFDWNMGKNDFTLDPNAFGFQDRMNKKSKIIIQKDGKDPLVIEDGEVIKGGEGYSEEEINKFKKENKMDFGDGKSFSFRFDDNDINDLKEKIKIQMEKFQNGDSDFILRDNGKNSNDPDYKKAKEEMLKAKEEMQKAREELEKTRQEMQKTKSEMKMRKA